MSKKSTIETKKRVEKAQFEMFRRVYGRPNGYIRESSNPYEGPDIVVCGSHIIGVEVTELHKNNGAEKKQHDLRSKVIVRAEEIYKRLGGDGFEFWVDFDPENPIENVTRSAKRLADFALRVSKTHGECFKRGIFEGVPEIRSLHHNGVVYSDAKWMPAQVHDVPTLDVEQVKLRIAKKLKSRETYIHCDYYWLLIIVEFFDPSQDQYIDWPDGLFLKKDKFEKIFIYKTYSEEITEVPLREI